MPSIVHFEIPVDEVERARNFYETLFGWRVEQVPGMDYWFVKTSGEHPVGGGMMKRRDPQQPIINYIDVRSVDEYTAKVEQLGGRVVVPKMAVPAMGYFAICLDTEGNTIGLWQTDTNAR